MTKQEIKDLLKRHTYVEEEIRNCEESMQCLVDDIEYERDLKAYVSDGMPHTKNGHADPTYKKAQKILDEFKDEIASIEKRQEGLLGRKNLVKDMMDILTPKEREFIKLRYFKKYAWWMVTSKMKYSKSSCLRFQKSALNKIEKWAIDK
jgi:DNA-directed RNA polymerase specialized sigma subunit